MNIITSQFNYDSSFDLFSVGMEQPWDSDIAPMGWMFKHGQLVHRKDYQRLFHWAKINNLIIPDNEWLETKHYTLFSFGDDETTFRLPDKRGMYDVGYETGYHSGLGLYQQDQFQGHAHRRPTHTTKKSGTDTAGTWHMWENLSGVQNFDIHTIISTGSYGTPRIGTRTQPRSLPRNYIIKY